MGDNIYIFDCEVFAHDWLFVFKEIATGEYTVIHNDNDAVVAFMERDPFLGGFNNKHYDNFILKAEIPAPNPETAKAAKKEKKQKAPATATERKAAKENLTDTEGNADALQIAALKKVCKELLEKDESQEDFVQQIAMKTQGFTVVTRSACEQLIKNLGEMIESYGKENE